MLAATRTPDADILRAAQQLFKQGRIDPNWDGADFPKVIWDDGPPNQLSSTGYQWINTIVAGALVIAVSAFNTRIILGMVGGSGNASAGQGVQMYATSDTSILNTSGLVGTTVTLTVSGSIQFGAGQVIRVASRSAPAALFFDAIVTSFSGNTLVAKVTGQAGSATAADWNVNV
jgi:hypothetical protein